MLLIRKEVLVTKQTKDIGLQSFRRELITLIALWGVISLLTMYITWLLR